MEGAAELATRSAQLRRRRAGGTLHSPAPARRAPEHALQLRRVRQQRVVHREHLADVEEIGVRRLFAPQVQTQELRPAGADLDLDALRVRRRRLRIRAPAVEEAEHDQLVPHARRGAAELTGGLAHLQHLCAEAEGRRQERLRRVEGLHVELAEDLAVLTGPRVQDRQQVLGGQQALLARGGGVQPATRRAHLSALPEDVDAGQPAHRFRSARPLAMLVDMDGRVGPVHHDDLAVFGALADAQLEHGEERNVPLLEEAADAVLLFRVARLAERSLHFLPEARRGNASGVAPQRLQEDGCTEPPGRRAEGAVERFQPAPTPTQGPVKPIHHGSSTSCQRPRRKRAQHGRTVGRGEATLRRAGGSPRPAAFGARPARISGAVRCPATGGYLVVQEARGSGYLAQALSTSLEHIEIFFHMYKCEKYEIGVSSCSTDVPYLTADPHPPREIQSGSTFSFPCLVVESAR